MTASPIVLTDADPVPAPVLRESCPRCRTKPPIVASCAFGEPHGICSGCGYEPLVLPKEAGTR